MGDLDYAARAAHSGCFDEASAIALVSIAESLSVLAAAARATHGSCVDCGHPWTRHTGTGCQHQHATGRICPCTERSPL